MSVDRSFYSFLCICGEKLTSESTETTCPTCKRTIVIEWQAEYSAGGKGKS